MQFNSNDADLSRRDGSVVAFACECDIGTTFDRCSNQQQWSCNNASVYAGGTLGPANGRWMLKDFSAREAQVGQSPPSIT